MKIVSAEVSVQPLPPVSGRIPLAEMESLRQFPREILVLTLRCQSGKVGVGVTCAAGAGSATLRTLLETEIVPLLLGENSHTPDHLRNRVAAAFRGVGFSGLVLRAWAAVDLALWDLRGRVAGLPVHQLLGGARTSATAYLSDVVVPGMEAKEALRKLRPLLDSGIQGFLLDLLGDDPQSDADRIQELHQGLSEQASLSIRGNGKYDLSSSLALADFFADDVGIDWLEEPLPWADRQSWKLFTDRAEVPLAAGATLETLDDFHTLLSTGGIRLVRPDLFRVGGLTNLLKIATIAEVFRIPVIASGPAEVLIHAACGISGISAVEVSEVVRLKPTRTLTQGRMSAPDQPGLLE